MALKDIKTIYYRGSLKSCNYTCSYCVFAGRKTPLDKDKLMLIKFADKILSTSFTAPVNIFITPYGEAMTHEYYYDAIAKLSASNNVASIGIQSNASFNAQKFINYVSKQNACLDKVSVWATFHPEMTTPDKFANNVNSLNKHISVSVGAVGFLENKNSIDELHEKLDSDIYFWINKPEKTTKESYDFSYIDAQYKNEELNLTCDPTKCIAGVGAILVTDNGDIRACHKHKESLGNIYDTSTINSGKIVKSKLRCDCYLSYNLRSDISSMAVVRKSDRAYNIKPPKAIFFDIDGTLLTDIENHFPLLKSIKADLYFVTGRDYSNAITLDDSIKQGVFGYGSYIVADGFKKTYPLKNYKNKTKVISHKPIKAVESEKLIVDGGLHMIVDSRASKKNGVLDICSALGYDKNTIWVVGNEEQDCEMLEHFANSFAVSNSSAKAKSCAKNILDIKTIIALASR